MGTPNKPKTKQKGAKL